MAGNTERLFINPDFNPKEQRAQVLCRRVIKSLRCDPRFATLDLRVDKYRGVVRSEYAQLCMPKINSDSREDYELL